MCGIFGIISPHKQISNADLSFLAKHAEQRGKDSSGLFVGKLDCHELHRANKSITLLLKDIGELTAGFVIGHSRLITNGLMDNQPVYRDDVCVIHNGIVVNHNNLWEQIGKTPNQKIDTEIIAAITAEHLAAGGSVDGIAGRVLDLCKGVVACAVALPKLGKLVLFSNNGSLYYGTKQDSHYFSSESYPIKRLNCKDVTQVRSQCLVIEIPAKSCAPIIHENGQSLLNLIPNLGTQKTEEGMLEYAENNLKRCTRCILPETMPFIRFDDRGVCNYCRSHKTRNKPKPIEDLIQLVEPYRRSHEEDCIVPFSGGRDSCYALHLITKELKMKPITYTYDWGMVTDLGRRNISRMSSALGVENIIVADNLSLKRRNISMNFKAWLKSPNLGMVSILTAGDKHFFRHVETIKQQTGIPLNLWGVNPLEVTHFKAGFLGVPPDFAEERVYSHGALKQLRYQWLRLKAMSQSIGYFNSSLWDTLSGEYYRSFNKKTHYYHIFDYTKLYLYLRRLAFGIKHSQLSSAR